MVTHFRILAWEIPWTEEPGGLQSMGSQSDGHDFVTKQQHPCSEIRSIFPLYREGSAERKSDLPKSYTEKVG